MSFLFLGLTLANNCTSFRESVGEIHQVRGENPCTDWIIDVDPTSGDLESDECDTITVDIDTSDLPEGTHNCDIDISSNGGSGTFTMKSLWMMILFYLILLHLMISKLCVRVRLILLHLKFGIPVA